MSTQQIRPQPNVLYGLTHDALTGAEIIRVPRTVKVGIGRPAGPDIFVFINMAGKWSVETGLRDQDGKRQAKIVRFDKREAAVTYYREQRKTVQELRYPMKLAYFTFSKPMGDGSLDPDWDAIERHGALPTEIDIVFMDNEPLRAAYEMWAASGIQCRGDGINAERILSMATDDQKELVEEAKGLGSKFFTIHEGCCLRGCPYAQPTEVRKREVSPLCKPHASLSFQLINDIRLGAQARFDTTSAKSIAQLHSSLLVLRSFTGGGSAERGFVSGIPLRLFLRPWKTNHNGQTGKAYAVSIEVRAESIEALRRKIIAAGADFRQALQLGEPAKQIAAPVTTEEMPEEVSGAEGSSTVAEFYPEAHQAEQSDQEMDEPPEEGGEPDAEGEQATESTELAKVAEATDKVKDDLKAKLQGRRTRQAAQPVAEPPAPPATPAPSVPTAPPAAPAAPPFTGDPVEDLF